MRFSTVVAKASFWIVCYHYFGSANLLLVAAAWTFILAIKDLTFARIRLGALADPTRFGGALVKSVLAEAALLAVRVGIALLVLPVIAMFNDTAAQMFAGLVIAMLFWSKETLIALASSLGVARWRRYVLLLGNSGALAGIVLLAENEVGAVAAATTALVLREALVFTGSLLIVLAGFWINSSRRRPDSPDDHEDDDDDGSLARVLDADGNPVRSATKVLIADNYVYSRWRIIQFWTRTAAHGVFGPFGSIAARFYFSYRRPGPYQHRETSLSAGRIVLMVLGAAVMISAVAYIAFRLGLLHVLGIVAAAFALRIIAQSFNFLLWRKLKPLVGSKAKIQLPGKAYLKRFRTRDGEN